MKLLRNTVHVTDPITGGVRTLMAGEVLPAWAVGLVADERVDDIPDPEPEAPVAGSIDEWVAWTPADEIVAFIAEIEDPDERIARAQFTLDAETARGDQAREGLILELGNLALPIPATEAAQEPVDDLGLDPGVEVPEPGAEASGAKVPASAEA